MKKDYYTILGINKSATDEEVKKAYRKLAHQYHPDKKGGNEQKFKEINEAYQILSNKEKRAAYDRFGTADFGNGFPGGGPFGFDVGGDGMHFDFGGAEDLGDIFEAFFEGMGVRPKRKSVVRGADLELTETVTLEEAFKGAERTVAFRAPLKCSTCNGEGADEKAGYAACEQCEGRGEVKETRKTFFGAFAQVKQCGKCRGRGKIPHKICAACAGAGRAVGEHRVELSILAGVADGQIIRIAGEGEAGEHGAPPGDLYVRIAVKPHEVFERKGDDLFIRYKLDAIKALVEDKIVVKGIDGAALSVLIPEGTSFGVPVRISGAGMPRFNARGRGDLVLAWTILKPKKIDGKLKKALGGE